jgi:hypothetical protein
MLLCIQGPRLFDLLDATGWWFALISAAIVPRDTYIGRPNRSESRHLSDAQFQQAINYPSGGCLGYRRSVPTSALREKSRRLQGARSNSEAIDASDSSQAIWHALPASRLLDQIVKSPVPPDIGRLCLDGEGQDATRRRWHEELRAWTPATFVGLSPTGSVQTHKVFGGSADEILIFLEHP